MADQVWHLHRPREEFFPDKNTVRGTLVGTGAAQGGDPLLLYTVENLKRRIRAGVTYVCEWDYYHKGDYACYEIIWPFDEDGDGVPDRDRLLIHAANAVRNQGGELILLGCVAPGMRYAPMWGQPGVASSRDALARFHEKTAGAEKILLKVTEDAP